MKINLQSGSGTQLEFINKTIDKNIDSSFHRNIQNAIDAVNTIWSRDIVVRNYTSHRLDHNIRVLYYCYELIEISGMVLNETGYYILTIAALLHDFGMQCLDMDIIEKYMIKEKTEISDIEDIVRKNHAQICVDWMKKLYKEPSSESGKLISLIDPRHMKPICDVIEYHSGERLYKMKENLVYAHNDKECKLLPIILILRLADELDIGCERSDKDMSLRDELEKENLSYFWLHYITQISFVSSNIIKITVETHSYDKDKHLFFKDVIYNSFLTKNKPLLDMLSYCDIHLSIEYDAKINDFLEKFNPAIYDYLASKYIDKDDYFDNIVNITYYVPDIGEIFDLDYKLLPMLYKDSEEHYAVTKEQSYLCAERNPNMTIAAYKHGKVIGYLTLWPVSNNLLNKLLDFEILESEVDFCNDIYTYQEQNKKICWYVSGLGICNEERGRRNDPMILQQLIENAIKLAEDILKPRNIVVDKIGAVVYSRSAENLCLRHFGMKVVKNASYHVAGYVPRAVCVDVRYSTSNFIKRLRAVFDS